MFNGENLITIDGKGRVVIPVRFREELRVQLADLCLMLTKASPVEFADGSYGRGLSVYPVAEWQELEKRIVANEARLPLTQLNSLKRMILASGQECMADKLGRILIPSSLRQYAGLVSDVYMIGMGNRFDIWSSATYLKIQEQDEKNFPSDSELLSNLGL